jgi:hypothetical protein
VEYNCYNWNKSVLCDKAILCSHCNIHGLYDIKCVYGYWKLKKYILNSQ